MSRALESGEVKALFRQLVAAAGGVEACGLTLGVSHQRVSQLQSVNNPDMPTFAQIMALEVVAERPIITAVAAQAIEGHAAEDLSTQAVAVVSQGARTLQLVHDMDADGARTEAEVRAVQRATQESAEAAERLAASAARLSVRTT